MTLSCAKIAASLFLNIHLNQPFITSLFLDKISLASVGYGILGHGFCPLTSCCLGT
jgi:hypothetical protein